MLRFAFCLAVLVAAAPAYALDKSSEPLPGAASPSQVQIDAALEVMNANGSAANLMAMIDTLAPIEAAQIKKEHPGASDAIIATLQGVVRTAVVAHQDDLLRLYAIGYARHFTVEELHALAAFYKSDVGQKYIHEIPALVKDMTPVGISYVQKIAVAAVEDAIQKLQAQGVKI
jgi:hypothetical protein